jgi:hypothetical protein
MHRHNWDVVRSLLQIGRMQFHPLASAVLGLVIGVAACATQPARPGVTSQQAPNQCLREGTPCASGFDCCSGRCESTTGLAPIVSPEDIHSRSLDDLPVEPPSGLGTPGRLPDR